MLGPVAQESVVDSALLRSIFRPFKPAFLYTTCTQTPRGTCHITSGLLVIRPQAAESLQIGPFHVRVVGLPWLAPSQTPQSARREDEGEAPEPAERPECPDEEEAAGGLGDLAVMCPPHVDDGHDCREQPDEQHDDV